MIKKSSILLFIFLLFLCACSSAGNKKSSGGDGSLRSEILDISRENSRIFPSGRPVRLAVVTFMPTGRKKNITNSFGHYVAESLMSNMKRFNPKIQLFERERLDAILKEHRLSLTGAVSRNQAKKIGRLAPIDFIITGTYTLFPKRVEINGRTIDVVTGEITYTFSRSLRLDVDSKKFFDRDWISPYRQESREAKCRKKVNEINLLLSDLTTAEKIESVVSAAIKNPFEKPCSDIHMRVLLYFKKYRIFNKRYTAFLNETLNSIKNPAADRRAGTVLSYFNSRGYLSPEQWEAGLHMARRNRGSYISSYLSYLFFPPRVTDTSVKLQQERVDRYMAMAKRGGIGLPVPVSYEKAFHEMLRGLLTYSRRRNVPLAVYTYNKYHGFQKVPDRIRLYRQLKYMYRYSADEKAKKQVLVWICENFNASSIEMKLGRSMMDFARLLVYPLKRKKSTAEEVKTSVEHFAIFKKICRDKLAEALSATSYESEKRRRALFCIEHNIYAPKLVPPMDKLKKQLAGNAPDVINALILLDKMGKRAKPVEKALVRLLVRTEKKQIEQPVQIRNLCFEILVNIRSRNGRALKIVHRHAMKGGSEAVKTAVKLGKPMVPFLVRSLRSRDYYTKIQAAVVIKEMGDPARKAIPELKRQRKKSKNQRLNDEIDEALARMQ